LIAEPAFPEPLRDDDCGIASGIERLPPTRSVRHEVGGAGRGERLAA
jgi:hypothetical protein